MAKPSAKPDTLGPKRSRAAKIIGKEPIIAGSIVEMVHTCGKPSCRCRSGDKHVSPYLCVRRKGKRTMISIPRLLEDDVREAVGFYKELSEIIEALSIHTVNQFVTKKKRGG
jgi:hypothetical protein